MYASTDATFSPLLLCISLRRMLGSLYWLALVQLMLLVIVEQTMMKKTNKHLLLHCPQQPQQEKTRARLKRMRRRKESSPPARIKGKVEKKCKKHSKKRYWLKWRNGKRKKNQVSWLVGCVSTSSMHMLYIRTWTYPYLSLIRQVRRQYPYVHPSIHPYLNTHIHTFDHPVA